MHAPASLVRGRAVEARRFQERRRWVVFFSISGPFGPPPSRERPSQHIGGRCIAEKPPVGLGWDKSEIKPARIQSAISSLKNAGFDASSYADLTNEGYGDRIVSRVFDLYEKTLQQRNAVDFDDMLSLTARLLEHSPATRQKYAGRWKHVLVDEFQDTNSVQYQLLSLLARDHKNVFVAWVPLTGCVQAPLGGRA